MAKGHNIDPLSAAELDHRKKLALKAITDGDDDAAYALAEARAIARCELLTVELFSVWAYIDQSAMVAEQLAADGTADADLMRRARAELHVAMLRRQARQGSDEPRVIGEVVLPPGARDNGRGR